MLRNGTPAPPFTLTDQHGQSLTLEGFKNKVTLLVFHRGRFCPTTDRFLSAYQDIAKRLRDLDIILLAISADTLDDNRYLGEKFTISFPLLSDETMEVSEAYGIYKSTNKGRPFGEPGIVVIDVDGKVAYSVISSGPKGLPSPGDVLPVLLYMHSHKGRY